MSPYQNLGFWNSEPLGFHSESPLIVAFHPLVIKRPSPNPSATTPFARSPRTRIFFQKFFWEFGTRICSGERIRFSVSGERKQRVSICVDSYSIAPITLQSRCNEWELQFEPLLPSAEYYSELRILQFRVCGASTKRMAGNFLPGFSSGAFSWKSQVLAPLLLQFCKSE